MRGRSWISTTVVDPLARQCDNMIGSLIEIRTDAQHVVLTYDDGPCPTGTEPILAALQDHHATATFFMLLSRARRYPTLVTDVVDAGHEIGLHGLDHRRLTGFTPREIERRTRDGKRELEDLAGHRVRWFRPPYGKQTFRRWRAITRCGLASVSWGPNMADWKEIPQSERIDAAMRGVRPGSIVLAHDGFAGPDDGVDDGPAPVIDRGDLARRVLDAYREQGLHARSLASALNDGSEVRRAWFEH